jgi:hypothetical protein
VVRRDPAAGDLTRFSSIASAQAHSEDSAWR